MNIVKIPLAEILREYEEYALADNTIENLESSIYICYRIYYRIYGIDPDKITSFSDGGSKFWQVSQDFKREWCSKILNKDYRCIDSPMITGWISELPSYEFKKYFNLYPHLRASFRARISILRRALEMFPDAEFSFSVIPH